MARRNFTSSDLGRLAHFDPKNADYLIADYLVDGKADAKRDAVLATRSAVLTQQGTATTATQRSKRPDVYHARHPWEGDQGNTPRCTGFSTIKAWLAGPSTHRSSNTTPFLAKLGILPNDFDALADVAYQTAVKIDRQEHGLHFDGGATMLAIAKAGQRLGLWASYYWGYSLSDFLVALKAGYTPILGIWWREGMDEPAGSKAIIRYVGGYRGGHAIVSDGLDIESGGDMARLDQTWGRKMWGANGYCRFPLSDLERAIADDGEVLIVQEIAA